MFPFNEPLFYDLGGTRSIAGLINSGFANPERAVDIIARPPFYMNAALDTAKSVLSVVSRAVQSAALWVRGAVANFADLPVIPATPYGNISGGSPGIINAEILGMHDDKRFKTENKIVNFSIEQEEFETQFWEAFRQRLAELIREGHDTVTYDDVFVPDFNVWVPLTLYRTA